MKESIEILLDDGSNRLAVWRNAFVHVRRGAQTVQSLDLLIGTWRSLKRSFHGDIFAITIIAADAGTVSGEVRKRRAAIAKELFAYERLHLAVVIEGEGLLADLRRTMVRGLVPARTKVFSDAWEAARMVAWLPGAPTMIQLLAVIDAVCPRSTMAPVRGRRA